MEFSPKNHNFFNYYESIINFEVEFQTILQTIINLTK
jgi:hypothetical protein